MRLESGSESGLDLNCELRVAWSSHRSNQTNSTSRHSGLKPHAGKRRLEGKETANAIINSVGHNFRRDLILFGFVLVSCYLVICTPCLVGKPTTKLDKTQSKSHKLDDHSIMRNPDVLKEPTS
jgi:hypothetical protein